jgi:hypothetical protein
MFHPTQLSKYKIVSVLGEGAMGVVYKATDPVLKRTVAIKTIHRHLVENGGGAAMLARFRNEALASARLMHPNIVTVHDYGEHDFEPFIVMEYVEGNTLGGPLRNRVRFDEAAIVDLMAQLLDGLHCAHGQGVWHRDIKPSNLLLTPAGQLKIADFGIARIASMGLTQLSSAIGTPGHMAPEQYSGEQLDRRVDVFAAGVLLYALLCQRQPFVGSNENVMFQTLNSDPLPPSRVHGSRRPEWFDAIVARAMAKRPDDRYPDALAFRGALVQGLAGEGGAPPGVRVTLPAATFAPDDTVMNPAVWNPASERRTQPGIHGAGPQEAPPVTAVPAQGSGPQPSPAEGRPAAWKWDDATLGQLEAELSKVLGPIARVLVRRASMSTRDLESLRLTLARQIDTELQRDQFMKRTRPKAGDRSAGGASVPGATGRSSGSASAGRRSDTLLGEQAVRRAESELAVYIGPIARVVVSRAAARAQSVEEFLQMLSQEVADEEDQQRLLARLQKSFRAEV